MGPQFRCSLCDKDMGEENAYCCPVCLSTFHYECLVLEIRRNGYCPICGVAATLWNFKRGFPRLALLSEEIDISKENEYQLLPMKKEISKAKKDHAFQYLCSFCGKWIDEDDKNLVICGKCDAPFHRRCLNVNHHACCFCRTRTDVERLDQSNRIYRNAKSPFVREVPVIVETPKKKERITVAPTISHFPGDSRPQEIPLQPEPRDKPQDIPPVVPISPLAHTYAQYKMTSAAVFFLFLSILVGFVFIMMADKSTIYVLFGGFFILLGLSFISESIRKLLKNILEGVFALIILAIYLFFLFILLYWAAM